MNLIPQNIYGNCFMCLEKLSKTVCTGGTIEEFHVHRHFSKLLSSSKSFHQKKHEL